MLARDRVTLTIGGRSYKLRPKVSAAIRLEYAFGMAAVLKGIDEGNVTIMSTIIRETADIDLSLSAILDDLAAPTTLAFNMKALREPLAGLVLSMYGMDPEAAARPPEPGAKMIPAAEHLAQLYRYATGWMGWAPSVALDSTAFEITEAFKGHVEMLNAIHGGKPPEAEPVDLDTKARAIFGGLAQRFRDRQPKAA